MSFNPNPTAPIPDGIQTTIIWDWAGLSGNIPTFISLGREPDGHLSIVKVDNKIKSIDLDVKSFVSNTYVLRTSLFKNSDNTWTMTQGGVYYPSDEDVAFYLEHPETVGYPHQYLIEFALRPMTDGVNFDGAPGRYNERTFSEPLFKPTGLTNLLKPQIKDYFTGYILDPDPYTLSLDLIITSPISGNVKLDFYTLTDEIQFDGDGVYTPTINLDSRSFYLYKKQLYHLKLDCIPCSITIQGDPALVQFLKSQISAKYSRCFPDELPTVKAKWEALYAAKKAALIANPKLIKVTTLDVKPYVWAATPRWSQPVISDLNTGQGIGETVPDTFITEKYFQVQNDGTFGSYIMPDSALVKKIGAALDVDTWGVNPDNPNSIRGDNLGWRINRASEVLGVHVASDGSVNNDFEKQYNRRTHAEGTESNDLQEYNPMCFASRGMLVRYLPNKFSPTGTVQGGYRKVPDLPQLILELHEQANAAMGYQEGTAIEIQLDGETYRYPNQLALLTELFVTAKQVSTYSKGSFFSSVIAEQSIKEVIGGLGLRTVDKYLEFKVGGKVAKLYYKGISASQSIRRKLSAVATNVGITLGNII
jgi:hypothetical protein